MKSLVRVRRSEIPYTTPTRVIVAAMASLNRPASTDIIAQRAGKTMSSVKHAIPKLIGLNRVVESSRHRYELTELGRRDANMITVPEKEPEVKVTPMEKKEGPVEKVNRKVAKAIIGRSVIEGPKIDWQREYIKLAMALATGRDV